MDDLSDSGFPETFAPETYDDVLPYDDQPPPATDGGSASLANRIGHTKVYLLSESSAAKVGKRKHGEDGDEDDENDDDDEMQDGTPDHTHRPNALLLHGPPISQLSTSRLFAYATHFDAHPIALEWINDNTAVFVFSSNGAARMAYRRLQKSATEDPDEAGHVTAKPIPVAFWPPEERITQSLGKGEGLKGTIKLRWAKIDDVKKKGAKYDSDFYKKHGSHAGKELYVPPGERLKRGRDDGEDLAHHKRVRVDDDLDGFLSDESVDEPPPPPPPPPSKMRSDYIAADGRTLIERTSLIRAHPISLASRLTAPLPRRKPVERRRPERNAIVERIPANVPIEGHGAERRNRGRRGARPAKSQRELDDELEAFLNDRD